MTDDTPDTDPAPTTSPTGEPPICAAARALVGLTEDDDAYRAIVDSSCMLVAAWLLGWRGRFVPDTIQVTLARLWGSGLRLPDVDNLLGPGAQVWWAANPASGAVEHVDGCVIAVERHTLYAATITVIAGGQRVTQEDVDAGAFPAAKLGQRCIKLLKRGVHWAVGGWVDDANGRRVRGVLDAA